MNGRELKAYERRTEVIREAAEMLSSEMRARDAMIERIRELEAQVERASTKRTFAGWCRFIETQIPEGVSIAGFLRQAEVTKWDGERGAVVLRATGFCYTSLMMVRKKLSENLLRYCGSGGKVSLRYFEGE